MHRAPAWAVPFLAAYLVAKATPGELRGLGDAPFKRIARGFDQFLIGTTAPWFLVALLLPSGLGTYLVSAVSVWGMLLIGAVGKRVALERKRRKTQRNRR